MTAGHDLATLIERTVDASIRSALDAVAAGFEEAARDCIEGEDAVITYRDLIHLLHTAGPHPVPA